MGLFEDSWSGSSRFSSKCKRNTCCSLILVVVITAISLLAVSLKKIGSTEIGLQYNVHKKQLDDAAKTGGLHAGPPGFEFIKFPSTFITEDLPAETCLSKDGLPVQFQVTFQYQMPEEWLVPAVIKYRNFEKWATIVTAVGNSAVQHACSEFDITSFQHQRGVIQARMEENLRYKLEGAEGTGGDGGVYARAVSLQLRNVELPEEYQEAVRDKQAAAEDIELARNQRTQETTKARTELLAAGEEARKINDTAVVEAELLLTEARLKAEETIFAFQKEGEIITKAKENFNLTVDGVISYMANRLLGEVPTLKVSAGEPAKLSRKEEL